MDESKHDEFTMPNVRLSDEDARAFDAMVDPESDGDPGRGVGPKRMARMEALLSLIDQTPVEDPPADLAERTLSRVRQAVAQERAIENEQAPAAPLFSFGWAQLGTYAALILVGLSLAFPALANFRQGARQTVCAANMHNVGAAFSNYAVDHGNALPRLSTAAGIPWWNVGKKPASADAPVESNSAHLYLLARQGYVDHNIMNCPNNVHAPRTHAADQIDWNSAPEVSYSYQNQYTNQPVNPAETPELAVLADKNPLFVPGGRQSLRYDQDQAPTAASRSHNSRGQNVLRNDGSVQWQDQPVVNDIDNIWTIRGVERYSGRERPEHNNDSFLVP